MGLDFRPEFSPPMKKIIALTVRYIRSLSIIERGGRKKNSEKKGSKTLELEIEVGISFEYKHLEQPKRK